MNQAIPQLHDYLIGAARERPDDIAVVADGRRYTYRDVDVRSNGVAAELARQGIARGDRVLVVCDNSIEAVVAFWGVLKANAVVSPVHPQTRIGKLAFIANDCRAKAVVVDSAHAAVAQELLTQAPHLRAIVHADGEACSAAPLRLGIDLDLAAIIYTSGSTGEPKGVMLTHRNMLSAATSVSTYLEMGPQDVVLNVLPLSFDYGLYQMIMTFRVGGRLVLEKGFAYPATVLARVVDEGVTGFPGVPTIFATMLAMKGIRDYDFSAVRYVTNTAAALPVEHILRLRELFPEARIFSMYGLTECKRCTYLPPEDLERKPGSVGLAIPNTEMWIVDADGNRVGPDVVGELVIRGPTVMAGYWERPDETAQKLRPGPLPGERVLHTGDFGSIDAEGYLTFVGRMDDIIKSRGEKVAPKEIESVLHAIPGVNEAAVVGIPDEILGQAPIAFVVLAPGATVDAVALRRVCQQRLEPYMVPTSIEIVPALPRSMNGKIDRRALAASGGAS